MNGVVGRPSAESEELIRALLDPALYPHSPAEVELRETHISWVFLAGELAYKVKKPLVLAFLDYGTLERRHEMCRAEVELNRRLAPRIYLAVVGIARDGDGFRFTAESDPMAIEYAVKMTRVEEDRSLAALAAAGTLTAEQITASREAACALPRHGGRRVRVIAPMSPSSRRRWTRTSRRCASREGD